MKLINLYSPESQTGQKGIRIKELLQNKNTIRVDIPGNIENSPGRGTVRCLSSLEQNISNGAEFRTIDSIDEYMIELIEVTSQETYQKCCHCEF